MPAMREVDPLDLLETIREGLLVLEPDLTIRFANRAFCDKFSSHCCRAYGRAAPMSSATKSRTFPSSAARSRPSFLAKEHSRTSKSNSSSRQTEGKTQETAGKIQNAVGGFKDAVKEAVND